MLCKKCGATISDTSKFCSKCGEKVTFQDVDIHPSTPDDGILLNENKNVSSCNEEVKLDTSLSEATIKQDDNNPLFVHARENTGESIISQDAGSKPAKSMDKKTKYILIAVAALLLVLLIAIPVIKKSSDYNNALDLISSGKYEEALVLLEPLSEKEYKNSKSDVEYCNNMIAYNDAKDLLESSSYYDAYKAFKALGDFEDSKALMKKCIQAKPSTGVLYRNKSYKGSSTSLTIKAPSGSSYAYVKIYASNGTLASTMFIAPGKRATVKLKSMTVKINVAYGTTWFGKKDMFGDSGSYTTLLFNESATTYKLKSNYIYTLTLKTAKSGNVGSKPTGRNTF